MKLLFTVPKHPVTVEQSRTMIKNLKLKKFMLYLNIGMIIILVMIGVKDYLSEESLGVDYWATTIMLFAILPGTIHIQNKE